MNAIQTLRDAEVFPTKDRVELLDWVSACQSAYALHGGRFDVHHLDLVGENRAALMDFVLEMLQKRHAVIERLRKALSDIAEDSTDKGAVECASDALKETK